MLKKKDDRQKAASFIKEESHKLGNMFQRLSHATNPKVNIMYYITYKLLFITQHTQVLEDLASLLHSSLENMPYIIGVSKSRNISLIIIYSFIKGVCWSLSRLEI